LQLKHQNIANLSQAISGDISGDRRVIVVVLVVLVVVVDISPVILPMILGLTNKAKATNRIQIKITQASFPICFLSKVIDLNLFDSGNIQII